jgi:hypothetical protein
MLVVSVKQYIIKCFIGILAQITALRPEKGVPEFGTLSLSLSLQSSTKIWNKKYFVCLYLLSESLRPFLMCVYLVHAILGLFSLDSFHAWVEDICLVPHCIPLTLIDPQQMLKYLQSFKNVDKQSRI